MKIHFIEFKNLFAYGEKLQRIEYSDSGKMTLLKGKSGSGKSSIMNLPSLLLYGKCEKISKPAIANRINKNGYIRGVIEKFGHTYEIVRTFAPYSIEIKKDGINLDNIGLKDGQSYIDKEIIDMPYSSFSNLISISMKRFKSFLSMNPFDRKTIIDRIFSLDFVNLVADQIKTDMRNLSKSLTIDNGSVFSLENSLKLAQSELENIRSNQMSSSELDAVESNVKQIEQLKNDILKCNQMSLKLNDELSKVDKTIKERSLEKNKIEIYKEQIKNKLDLFKNDKCPTCGASFKTKEFEDIVNKLDLMCSDIDKKIEGIDKSLSDKKSLKSKIANSMSLIRTKFDKIQREINSLELKNATIKNSISKTQELKSVENIISTTMSQLSEINKDIEKKTEKYDLLNTLLQIYSIDGIKQEVIMNYLPLFNSEISKNLLKLNFPYQLEFDAKFEPILTDLGNPISIETLSDGEMTRVDIVVLCSLLRILKRKYTSFNIFTIDELISYLDSENSEILLRFLKKFAEEMQLNIAIVSHVDISSEYFDETLDIVKEKGFSDIIRN